MKRIKFVSCLLLAGLVLIGCGNSESTESKTNKSTQASSLASGAKKKTVTELQSSSNQASDDTATSTPTEPSNTSATYNGSYYSVIGKYGQEIPIVNKQHPVDASYGPGEQAVAQTALYQLIAAMQGQGYDVSNNYSGFRSYDYQTTLYQDYVNRDGQAEADRYSARPGYSEHQTGLAFDLLDSSGGFLTEPQAASWLQENAHEYGFIVRYLPGKEAITGYMAESWHIRYIGQEAADIYASGLTLEEYFNVPGGNY